MGERGDTAGNGQVYSEGGDQGWSMPGVVTLSEHRGSVADMEGSGHTQKELLMGGGGGDSTPYIWENVGTQLASESAQRRCSINTFNKTMGLTKKSI